MILLYSIFAGSVILGGLITAISLVRSGYKESALQYTPEDPHASVD